MCKSQPDYPAHRYFINKFIDWDKVQKRLDQYPFIAQWFPLENLQRCSDKSPYYCHYLSWRLGTWSHDSWFYFFDLLLKVCSEINGWKENRIPKGCSYEEFWSFLWELRVAALFSDYLNLEVKWLDSGPDLCVHGESGRFFVECYVYRKSFGLEEFIQEIFFQICPDIIVDHIPAIIFNLPKGKKIEAFLDQLFRPFVSESQIEEKIKKIKQINDDIKQKNLFIYHRKFHKEILGEIRDNQFSTMGDPDIYLKLVYKEIIGNKKNSNNLSQNHPNILMVNSLLGKDWQASISLRNISTPELGESIDGIVLSACGINEIPAWVNSVYLRDNHPVKSITVEDENGYKFVNS